MTTLLKEVLIENKKMLGKAGLACLGFIAGGVLTHAGIKAKLNLRDRIDLERDIIQEFEDEVIDIQPEEVE